MSDCLEMPYLNSLATTYGQATNVRAASFPSLPNYIAATSGDYWGIADDALPAKHLLGVPNLFSQLPAGQAKVFAESMTRNCQLDDGVKTDINGKGFYSVRRTAWPYYTDSRDRCLQHQVPMEGNLQAAIDQGLPAFSQVVPATCNNFHKGGSPDVCVFGPGQTYKTRADAWLQTLIPKIMAGPDWKAGRLAVFIVWDEGYGPTPPFGADCTVLTLGGCRIPLVVLSPRTHGVKDANLYTTYSVLRTTQEILGLPLAAAGPDRAVVPDRVRALIGRCRGDVAGCRRAGPGRATEERSRHPPAPQGWPAGSRSTSIGGQSNARSPSSWRVGSAAASHAANPPSRSRTSVRPSRASWSTARLDA